MIKRGILVAAVLGLAIAAIVGWSVRSMIFDSAITDDYTLYIGTDITYADVLNDLKQCNCIENWEDFHQVAQWKKYPELVKPGKYELTTGMSNEDVVNKLRIGDQNPVKLTFNNSRTLDQLAGKVAVYLEQDSVQFRTYFYSDSVAKKYGFTPAQFPAMFVPNTYQINWNTSPEEFVVRMAQEFKRFWNSNRKAKASKLGLSQSEVVSLAAIVEEETKKADEKSRVAGVYLNRLKRNMKLQADPTLVFALGDFTIKRVTNKHKKIDSPYNTYMYAGLPPGPIRLPEISSVDAVLNFEQHNYLYFCAKEDFSGYHNFAESYKEHQKNARRYHRKLNERKIF
jgi:UPF0755 protein